jgi:hypothetical protein
MNKIIYYFIIVFLTSFYSYGFVAKNSIQKLNQSIIFDLIVKDSVRTLYTKDLNVKSFFKLFTEKYVENKKLNLITLSGDFPEKWVKDEDVEYLISLIKSKKKCCSYINIYSSMITNEEAEVGGFAIIFLNSYIENKQINLGLVYSPKTDTKSIEIIESWYKNQSK